MNTFTIITNLLILVLTAVAVWVGWQWKQQYIQQIASERALELLDMITLLHIDIIAMRSPRFLSSDKQKLKTQISNEFTNICQAMAKINRFAIHSDVYFVKSKEIKKHIQKEIFEEIFKKLYKAFLDFENEIDNKNEETPGRDFLLPCYSTPLFKPESTERGVDYPVEPFSQCMKQSFEHVENILKEDVLHLRNKRQLKIIEENIKVFSGKILNLLKNVKNRGLKISKYYLFYLDKN